jgi:hypothetical protein
VPVRPVWWPKARFAGRVRWSCTCAFGRVSHSEGFTADNKWASLVPLCLMMLRASLDLPHRLVVSCTACIAIGSDRAALKHRSHSQSRLARSVQL